MLSRSACVYARAMKARITFLAPVDPWSVFPELYSEPLPPSEHAVGPLLCS